MKFVTVTTFNLAHQAHLLKGKLESEGIPCIIADEHTITMNWFYSYALGGIKVKVPENRYSEALHILKKDYSEELKDLDENDEFDTDSTFLNEPEKMQEPKNKCPFCHSADVLLIEKTYPKTFLNKWTLGIIKPKPIRRYHCNICLNNWNI